MESSRRRFSMGALTGLATLLAVSSALSFGVSGAGPRTGPPAPSSMSANATCTGSITATLSASPVSLCDTFTVTARVQPVCPVCPDGINAVFVTVDTYETSSRWQSQEALGALDEMEQWIPPGAKLNVAVVHYNNARATTLQPMTDDPGKARSALTRFRSFTNNYSGVADRAAAKAVEELRRMRSRGVEPCEFVVFFAYTKSHSESMRERLQRAARTILGDGAELLVGCPMQDTIGQYCVGPEPEMPRSRRWFTRPPETGKLRGMALDVMRSFRAETKLRRIQLTQAIPAGLALVPGSASGAPSIAPLIPGPGTRLTWTWPDPVASEPLTVTYRLDPETLDRVSITGAMTITDAIYHDEVIPAPALSPNVVDLCPTPTPTPLPTPTFPPPTAPPPTRTPEPPTLTVTPSNTSTPTRTQVPPSSTPASPGVYLPLLLREKCVPEVRRVDVVLAIDASTSMTERDPAGGTKLDAAIAAARAFLGELRFDRGDQAAIVAFNAEATLLAPLTGDRAALDIALTGIQTAQQTCIACAVHAAAAELASPRHVAAHLPTLILLTDGRSNPQPVSEAVARAGEAKVAGVMIYTIGLGADIEAEALAAIASRPEGYFAAPEANALTGIYGQIAVALPCSAGAFWGGR